MTSQLLAIINCIFQIYLNQNLIKFFSFDCWKESFTDRFNFIINQTLQNLKKYGYEINPHLLYGKKNLLYCLFCEEISYSESENICLLCLNEEDDKMIDIMKKFSNKNK